MQQFFYPRDAAVLQAGPKRERRMPKFSYLSYDASCSPVARAMEAIPSAYDPINRGLI